MVVYLQYKLSQDPLIDQLNKAEQRRKKANDFAVNWFRVLVIFSIFGLFTLLT